MAGCGRGVVYRPQLGASPLSAQDLENRDSTVPLPSYSLAKLTQGLIDLFSFYHYYYYYDFIKETHFYHKL